jgi:hypothetical protein
MATHEYVPRVADADPNHAPPMMDMEILRATRSQYKANKVRKQEKVCFYAPASSPLSSSVEWSFVDTYPPKL